MGSAYHEGRAQAWALTNARGRLLVLSGHVPVYWLRRVAASVARQHGCQGAARIVRVRLRWACPTVNRKKGT